MVRKSSLKKTLKTISMTEAAEAEQQGNKWFSIKEMAAKEKVTIPTVRLWIEKGKLEAVVLCSVIHVRSLK